MALDRGASAPRHGRIGQPAHRGIRRRRFGFPIRGPYDGNVRRHHESSRVGIASTGVASTAVAGSAVWMDDVAATSSQRGLSDGLIPPTHLSATRNGSSVDLIWNAVIDTAPDPDNPADSYLVDRWDPTTRVWSEVGSLNDVDPGRRGRPSISPPACLLVSTSTGCARSRAALEGWSQAPSRLPRRRRASAKRSP